MEHRFVDEVLQSVRGAGVLRPSIIQVADYGGPYSGNFIASLCALEEVARQHGLRQVFVFSDIARDREWVKRLVHEGIPVYFIPKRNIGTLKQIREIIIRENGCLLHTHFTSFDVVAWVGAKLHQIPIVWHAHSGFPVKQTMARRLKDAVKLQLLGRSTTVVAVSDDIRNKLVHRGLSPAHVKVVHNGVDIQRATTATEDRADIRQQLELSPGTLTILVFGWEPVTKGIDLVLDAAEAMFRMGRNLAVVVVGEDALRGFVSHRFGGSPPSWLRIAAPRERVADLYQGADLFVSASRWEGFPYSVGEALANGLQIVASDIPGVQWAKEAPGSWFFESGNGQDLARVIEHAANVGPEERRQQSLGNIAFARDRLALLPWAERVLDLYQTQLG